MPPLAHCHALPRRRRRVAPLGRSISARSRDACGEQQRAVIARALVYRPKILIADEPTGNLDSINTREIIEILEKINQFGSTVLLLTHNREVVNHLKKRVITLDKGIVISDRQNARYLI